MNPSPERRTPPGYSACHRRSDDHDVFDLDRDGDGIGCES
jgi:hypothetical protein